MGARSHVLNDVGVAFVAVGAAEKVVVGLLKGSNRGVASPSPIQMR